MKQRIFVVLAVATLWITQTMAQSVTPTDNTYLSKETENPVSRQITLPLRYEADFLDGVDKLTKSTFEIDQAVLPFRLSDDWALITRTKLPAEAQRPCRQLNGRSKRHANSPHPSSREGHHSTTRWSSSVLLSELILYGFHVATACSLVQRNSVPSTQMRCMITANRRASATIAFFIPRRLAICIAQALSQDHFFERSML